MARTISFIIIFLSLRFNFVHLANYKIQVKNFLCRDVDYKYFSNVTCQMHAERGHRGIISILLEFAKPAHEMFDHIQVFTRTSTGRYQPWLFDLHLDACQGAVAYADATKQLKTVQVFMNFFEQLSPELKTGCPFTKPFNLSKWEFDKHADELLPHVGVEGDFVVRHRLHKKNNHTVLTVKFSFEVRPIGTADLIKLG